LNSDELVSIIEKEEADSIGVTSGELAEQRRKALQYYYGEPYGNEVEGRSAIVTTEVFDAVEGLLPSLLAIFTSADDVVRFEPQTPKDEAAAQQATDYVNYIFSRLNNGFVVLYCFFKDALLQKNGFVKVYWEKYQETEKDTYHGLTDDEFAYLQQEGLEVLEHTESVVNTPLGPMKTHDAKFQKTEEKGRVCIEPVPPEELLISRNTTNDIKNSRFVEHRTRKSISALREMGYDVPSDIADDSGANFTLERVQRLQKDDSEPIQETSTEGPGREVWVSEAYIRVDFDDDGIAELRKVTKVGKTILKEYKREGEKAGREANDEVDTIPFVSTTPIMMPHKLFGLSIADVTSDIQLTKSTVTRQLMDNAYNANNGRYAVLEGAVNIDDLLTSRPGGVVRMRVPGAVTRLDTPILGAPTFQLLDYWDRVMDNRIGVSPPSLASDPNLLNAKAHVAEIVRGAAQERVGLIARIFAETGVKDLFWKILELVSKHSNKPQIVRLRDQWVQIDPRDWKNKFDMTVTVGLGTGSQQTVLNGAQMIMTIQEKMAMGGLMGQTVTPKNIYEAAREVSKVVFPKKAGMFFTDPTTVPPPQPKPTPDEMKVQAGLMKAQMTTQQREKQMAVDYKKHQEDLQQERLLKGADIEQERLSQERDIIHEHIQGSMDRGMTHSQHRDTMGAKKTNGSGDSDGMDTIGKALQQMAQTQQAQTEAMNHMMKVLTQQVQQPQIPPVIRLDIEKQLGVKKSDSRKKRVSLRRDEKGDLVGADIEERGKGRKVTVLRDKDGFLIGADIEEN